MRLFQRSAAPAATESADDTPPDRGLVTLRDARISGWYNRDTGELYPLFPVGPGDRVVDVGCGDGGNLNFCGIRGADVTGIDLDAEALTQAEQRAAANATGTLTFATAPAEQLPLPDSSANRIVCTEVLEHVADPQAAVAELARIGESDALYLITVPDEVGEAILQRAADPSYFEHPNHIRIFSRESFAALVADAGLEILDHTTYGFFWTIWWSLFWDTGVSLEDPSDPLLDEWTRVWRDIVSRPQGRALKRRLDQIAPKTQVIVARKPA